MTKPTNALNPLPKNLTDEERDSLILSAIIGASVLWPEREVKPFFEHDSTIRTNEGADPYLDRQPDGPCCALGAGVLFRDLQTPHRGVSNFYDLFARRYGVTREYARAVSAGFENDLDDDLDDDDLDSDYLMEIDGLEITAETERGFQVGKAAFEALHGGGV